MINKPIISVENLSKKYLISHQQERRYSAMRDVIVNGVKGVGKKLLGRGEEKNSKEEFWALKDINFEIKQGDRVGIIGRNGAGKSTLLKILSRITEPSTGKIHLRGRVASLLEVGTGFHPELTGRENIYLNGAIMGMSKWEIKKKFDEIVDFAEVEKFLDTPVKRYSSGMYVRLAFAVAAHLEPEILIVDEVLAVGDAGFQKKCIGKMEAIGNEGRTVLFVSHNMGMVLKLCNLGVLLHEGKIKDYDRVKKVVLAYGDLYQSSSGNVNNRKDRKGNQLIKVNSIECSNLLKSEKGYFISGDSGEFTLSLESFTGKPVFDIEVALGVYNSLGQPMLYLGTKVTEQNISISDKTLTCKCFIDEVQLEPGWYYVEFDIKHGYEITDSMSNALSFEVKEGDFYGTGKLWKMGGFLTHYNWTHQEGNK